MSFRTIPNSVRSVSAASAPALASALALSLLISISSASSASAQQALRGAESAVAKPTPAAASAPTSVPALVPYTGFGIAADGKAVTGEVPVTFLIYKDEVGGQPLFTETQTAAFDPAGRYEVQLGATLSSGIPLDLFGSGEARWLEVQIAGAKTQPRALLVSVPYALKAGDASTLGGLPASAYALAGTSKSQALSLATTAGVGVTPDTITAVTTTGGTSGYLPVFNGTSTVVNSSIYQGTNSVGIGHVPNAAYELDVNGKSILRGNTILPNNGNASTSAGANSFPLGFIASAYNSSSKADVGPTFYWQAEPTGNNTAAPAGTMNLLYSSNFGTGAETGFSLNSNGTVHFASGQTFAATGASVAFNGTSTSGLGVEGTSTSNAGVQGNSTSSNGVYGKSSTGDGLQGFTGGTASHTAGVYGIAGTGNTSGFSGIAGVWGDANAHVGVYGSSSQYSGVFGQSATGNGVQGTSTSNFGVQGNSSSSYGVYGQTGAGSGAAAGVYGYSSNATPGVKGASASGDGGDFYAGGNGNGLLAVGTGTGNGVVAYGTGPADGVEGFGGNASGSGVTAGSGGDFVGGSGSGDGSEGGVGLYAFGGSGNGGALAGVGVRGEGGYADSGSAFEGGYFYGGSSDTGFAGNGIFAAPGYSSSNGSGQYAADLAGNVDVTGTLTADMKDFKIDHPLDPANKYLSHTSIESSEMVNLYSGNVTTDEQGLATVQLPS